MKKQKRDENGKFISSKKNAQVEQLRKEVINLNTKNNNEGVRSNAKLGMCLDGSLPRKKFPVTVEFDTFLKDNKFFATKEKYEDMEKSTFAVASKHFGAIEVLNILDRVNGSVIRVFER